MRRQHSGHLQRSALLGVVARSPHDTRSPTRRCFSTSPTQFQLIDTATLDVQELTLPPNDSGGELASFAFSPDNRWLAIGLHRKMLLYDRIARSWGASVQGDHKRSPLVGPMRFTADSRRVITLEDQLQVSVYNVSTGARLGRHVAAFEDWKARSRCPTTAAVS